MNQTQSPTGSTVGNPNTEGNKKSNYSYQSKVLQLLGAIMNNGGGGGGGGATEATALSILSAIQNGQEFEQNLVIDNGGVGCPGNCPTYLQIRIFNTDTHTFDPPIYYNAAGVVVVPVGPLQLVNPQFVLDNILTQVAAINADLDVALSTRASEATSTLQLAQLSAINTDLDVALSTRASQATALLQEASLAALSLAFDVNLSTRASEATVSTLLTTAAFQARVNTLGQKLSAASTPVVLASDQSSLPVTGTFFQATQPISAVVLPLPTGAATAALQTQPGVDIGDVTINNGAGVAAVNIQDGGNSITVDGTVAISNFPATQPVSAIILPLPTGAATAANQATEISSLASIDAGIPAALGQTTMAASMPIVLASDQSAIPAADSGSIFVFSVLNSTVAQLGAGATFTGVIESIVSQMTYSLLFFSDQNATITINQFIDVAGTKNIQQLVFSYVAGAKFARSGALNGNYIQLVVQNTGGSATTTLQADMAFGNIPPATQLNNNPVGIIEINGVVADSGAGASSAGSLRVMLANESIQDLTFIGQAAQTAAINNIIPVISSATATDLIGYRSGSIQLICPAGTYTTGAVTFEGSNDNVNFSIIPVYNQLILTGTPIIAAITLVSTTSIIYTFPVNFRYIRCRISTAITGASASVQAFSKFSLQNWTPAVFQVTQATGANLNAAISSLPTLATVTTVATVTTLANGQTADDAASTGNPIRIGGRVKTANVTTYAAGDAANIAVTTDAALIIKPYAAPELDWQFACTAAVANTTDVVLKAAAAAGIRNYITGLQIINSSATVATEVVVKDGATVIWRGFVGIGAVLNSAVGISLHTPLKGTAATALNFACITTGSAVYVNAQGYAAP